MQGGGAARARYPHHRRLCRWRFRMAELTYREAVARGIAQEMARDPNVVFLGEDIGKAGGVFKATVGLYEQFGPLRVRDTPISEQAILGAAVRDPDPVIFLEHKSLYPIKGDVPDGEIVDRLGTAAIVRPGNDATILALALMVPRAIAAADRLKSEHGIDCEVIDVRSLVPLDTRTILGSVARTHRLFTVEENPRLCGWGAEIVSIVADEAFYELDGPPVRITTPHIPLPAADVLEDIALPTAERIAETVRRAMHA